MAGGVKMVENIYSSETHGGTPSVLAKIPKNVRQIGQVNDKKKIYVEDYVMSFIKKVGLKKDMSSELVVLLGQFVKINNCQCTFVSGAIEIKDVIYEDDLVFHNETWTDIYETIKKYFTNVEIVGWSIIRAGLPLNIDERIQKVHVDNFAGQDKTLLLYDSLEREEAFYVFEENKLKRQDGYYIFYDKNPEMQNYIISLRGEQTEERRQSVPKHATIPKNSEVKAAELTPRRKTALMYGIGAVAAVVVLVFSAATLNNYDNKMKGIEKTIDVLSDSVQKENNSVGEPAVTGQESLPVETAKGKLSTINNEESSNEKNDESQVVESKVTQEPEASKQTEQTAEQNETKKSETPTKDESDKSEESKSEESKAASTSKNYYVVKEGDTLISISLKFYDTKSYVKKIKELNGIEDTNKIKVGQKLLLP